MAWSATTREPIRWSYSTGDVNTDVAMTNAATGGAVGLNHGGTLNQVYASGFVNASVVPGSFVGGLVGKTTGEVTVVNSYWDKGTTGQQHSAGGTGSHHRPGAPAGELCRISISAVKVPRWFMLDGQTRPFLRSEWSQRISQRASASAGRDEPERQLHARQQHRPRSLPSPIHLRCGDLPALHPSLRELAATSSPVRSTGRASPSPT